MLQLLLFHSNNTNSVMQSLRKYEFHQTLHSLKQYLWQCVFFIFRLPLFDCVYVEHVVLLSPYSNVMYFMFLGGNMQYKCQIVVFLLISSGKYLTLTVMDFRWVTEHWILNVYTGHIFMYNSKFVYGTIL